MAKLYHVTVETEYYALAETAQEAVDFVDEAIGDMAMYEFAHATEVKLNDYISPDWRNSLLYNNLDADVKMSSVLERMAEEEKERKKKEELDKLQGKLF